MARRVRRPKDKDELLETLTKANGGVFDTYKDALVFAAALGASKEKSKQFEQSGEPINYDVFQRYSDQEALISVISVHTMDGIAYLSEEKADDRLQIFEEHANGGLELIARSLKAATGRKQLDALVQLVLEAETTEEDTEEDINLAKLVDEIG